MISKKQILDLLWNNPIEVGHWVGFKDLTNIHNEWLRSFLYYDKDQTLQGHRGSYKTTTLALFFALHMIIKPNESILFFRKTGTDVGEILRTTSNILKAGCTQRIVQILYGKNLVIKNSSVEITTNLKTRITGNAQLVGLGIGTSITGKHADIIVTDDIVNVNDRVSKAAREATKRAYTEMQNIKNRCGRFINTGTPWHQEDAFSLMPNIKKYDCYHTGLISKDEISFLKKSMPPSLFAANYELRHIASEDIIFMNPVTGADPSLVEQARYCHVDAAYGGGDYTAFTIVKKTNNKYYVFGKLWHGDIEECIDSIVMWREHFNAGKIWVEDNADKGYLAKELRKQGERVVTYHESMNKYLKIVAYLKGAWSNIAFVQGTDEAYIQQITDYTDVAEHDDAPDSLASLIRVLWGKSNEDERYKSIFDKGV